MINSALEAPSVIKPGSCFSNSSLVTRQYTPVLSPDNTVTIVGKPAPKGRVSAQSQHNRRLWTCVGIVCVTIVCVSVVCMSIMCVSIV